MATVCIDLEWIPIDIGDSLFFFFFFFNSEKLSSERALNEVLQGIMLSSIVINNHFRKVCIICV